MHRDWLFGTTGSKVKRKGFTLVPDYASTGFMMQGETLTAAIAECGDVFTPCGRLQDIVTTYVILSRIKKADQLLLLQAFSPNLFRFGEPPGPLCLLKRMRSRRAASAAGLPDSYNSLAATTEYYVKEETWRQERQIRKVRGLEWPCGFCSLKFPAHGYIEDAKRHKSGQIANRDAVEEFCIRPGQTLRIMCTRVSDAHAHVVGCTRAYC